MNPSLEEEWEGFCDWRDNGPVDETWKLVVLATMRKEKTPYGRLQVVMDAMNRHLINRATARACLDTAW